MKNLFTYLITLFSVFCYSQSPWGDSPDTDCNATILIQPTTTITLNGDDIDFGSWVGAFYTDINGDMAFGGGIEWNGNQCLRWGMEF